MKKFIIAVAVLFLLLVICPYIFIPKTIAVSSAISFKAPLNGVFRCVSNEAMWQRWQADTNHAVQIKIIRSNAVTKTTEAALYHGRDSTNSLINLLNLTSDSIAIHWALSVDAGNSPFGRISNYRKAVAFKKEMDTMLEGIKNFTSNDDNIYGLHIYESGTQDTFVITTKTAMDHYPSTGEIYNLINELKTYCAKFGTTTVNHPMYNVTKINADSMRLMVGLPLNKAVPQTSNVSLVKMVQGRFLVTEVKGGEATVQHALTQLQYYFPEHNRTSMAIPFTYLITDRIAQPDTLQWISKIYAPVY